MGEDDVGRIKDVDDDLERLVDSLEGELRPFLDSLPIDGDSEQRIKAIEDELQPRILALELDLAADLAGGPRGAAAAVNPGGEAAGHDGPNRSGSG